MGGPLGKYSQLVAAMSALAIIIVQLVAWVAQSLGVGLDPPRQLETAFYVAVGAVFGAAASTSVNGQSIESAHRRLDLIAAPPAGVLEASGKQPHAEP